MRTKYDYFSYFLFTSKMYRK